MTTTRRKLIYLVAGPVGALIVYLLMPDQFVSGAGDLAPLDHPAKATLAMLVWMAI